MIHMRTTLNLDDALIEEETELSLEAFRVRPDLPVLMISGLPVDPASPFFASGAVRRILLKPHRPAELIEAIRELLG